MQINFEELTLKLSLLEFVFIWHFSAPQWLDRRTEIEVKIEYFNMPNLSVTNCLKRKRRANLTSPLAAVTMYFSQDQLK